MSLKDAFIFPMQLIAKRPTIVLPALITIFFTSIVVHEVLILIFRIIFGRLYNLQVDLLLLDLFVSVVVGIYLHAFYVGISKESMGGKLSMSDAVRDVNKHKEEVGFLGVTVHLIEAALIAALAACLFFAYYTFGLQSTAGIVLIIGAIISLLLLIYVSTLFFELNLAIIVENLSGKAALLRTINIANANLPKMLFAVTIVGILYAVVYLGLNSLSHNYVGTWHTAFLYLAIIPYTLVTIYFDLMAPGLYYKLVIKRKGKAKKNR